MSDVWETTVDSVLRDLVTIAVATFGWCHGDLLSHEVAGAKTFRWNFAGDMRIMHVYFLSDAPDEVIVSFPLIGTYTVPRWDLVSLYLQYDMRPSLRAAALEYQAD
jgi:hypothetical protein